MESIDRCIPVRDKREEAQWKMFRRLVEGGHRAIIFNRIGGVDQNTIHAEGLHFRVPWFQYPILYDIRARPRIIKSPTGSKGRIFSSSLPFHSFVFFRFTNDHHWFVRRVLH